MAEYCLIGEKLGHSFSKIIHEKMGYDYDLVEVPKDKLHEFVLKKEYKGYNVTIPYKQTIMSMLDVIDESAKIIGSVNTVINKDGKLYGYNTDIYGMEYAFSLANIVVNNKKVLVLGSGGTCATAIALAKRNNAREIVRVSRSGENNYSNISKHYDSNIIINTTPVGMFPNNNDQLISIKPFNKLEGVFDAIYNPLKTKLLLEADQYFQGPKYHCNGLTMLVAQAKYARDLFFGNTLDNSIINKITDEIEKDKCNYVLIGMPGCGKSSVGKELADRLNRKFLDTDEEICKLSGKTIPMIFNENGEQFFRNLESEIITRVSSLQGEIIATGGGVVLNENNILALKQNGVIVFIDRDINKLATTGRPLSKNNAAIQRIYDNRIGLYKKYADIIINGDGTISEVADNIEKSGC